MHTTVIQVGKREWRIAHNSDWSGDAVIHGPDGYVARLPGELFRVAARQHIASTLIALLEQY